VLQEKLDLLRGRAPGGRCLVGDEPSFLPEAARGVDPAVRVAGWSDRADADLRPGNAHADAEGRHAFDWRGQPVRLALSGRHAVVDALLALAVAEELGVSPAAAAQGVSGVAGSAMRNEVRRMGGLTLLVDCYNANPPSVKAALAVLGAREAARRVAVLGTMLELGPASPELHAEVLRRALAGGLDLVVATGAFAEVAREAAPDGRLVAAASWEEAYPELRSRLRGDELVLLKASRGVGLEGILPLLERDFGGGGEG